MLFYNAGKALFRRVMSALSERGLTVPEFTGTASPEGEVPGIHTGHGRGR